MAYALIAKLDKFTGKKNDAQVWLNDVAKAITANNWDNTRAMQAIFYFLQNITDAWYQSLAIKTQNFNEFKTKFLRYFSNNNSINKLANTFTTIKQGETEAVTTYLGQFYKNLCQIQVIQADYFTVPQILNQFIYGLHSSILQCVYPIHSQTLQNAVTNARDFETAKLEANHAQAINLVINRLSELDSKLKQLKSVASNILDQLTVVAGNAYLPLLCSISTRLSTYNTANISNTNDTAIILTSNLLVSSSNLSTAISTQLSAAVSGKLSVSTTSNTATELTSKQNSKTKINTAKLEIVNSSPSIDPQFHGTTIRILTIEFGHQNYLSLLVTPKDISLNNLETNQKKSLTNNIPLATITNDKSLAAIFPFKLKETTLVPLFSGAALDTKPITTMYTDAKVNGHSIKLILDSRSAGSIIIKQLINQLGHRVDHAASTRIITANEATKTLIGKIDDFPIEVNGIIVPIKVLVMKATQY
ncbi:hypothetical protein G9A89_023096 [Geosiphon pyriformis]|nr:hypothetical protein G9A89_023096 [Geosiphon pyriformis]